MKRFMIHRCSITTYEEGTKDILGQSDFVETTITDVPCLLLPQKGKSFHLPVDDGGGYTVVRAPKLLLPLGTTIALQSTIVGTKGFTGKYAVDDFAEVGDDIGPTHLEVMLKEKQ